MIDRLKKVELLLTNALEQNMNTQNNEFITKEIKRWKKDFVMSINTFGSFLFVLDESQIK